MSEPLPFEINREQLSAAIIKMNSMCRAQGIVMTRTGDIVCGNADDPDTLRMLLPAPILARQLTADGLSSYTGKELKKWADDYDLSRLPEQP